MVYQIRYFDGERQVGKIWITDFTRSKFAYLEDMLWAIMSRLHITALANHFQLLARTGNRDYGYGKGFEPVIVGSI
jgi:hypothetical protein